MTNTLLDILPLWQLLLVGVCFIWSGFVRSDIGFGGGLVAVSFIGLINLLRAS